jgi:F420H2 dehydrogenase subunit O
LGRILVRVFSLFHKLVYSNGAWKELCETCLDSVQKTYLSINKDEISCRRNKCVICSKKAEFTCGNPKPDFSKGVVIKR